MCLILHSAVAKKGVPLGWSCPNPIQFRGEYSQTFPIESSGTSKGLLLVGLFTLSLFPPPFEGPVPEEASDSEGVPEGQVGYGDGRSGGWASSVQRLND